jgi:hypothetical protein
MRSILAGVVAGIVVSVLILAAIVLSLPRGPVVRATPTPPVQTLPIPSSTPSLSPLPSGSGSVTPSPSSSLGAALGVGDQAPALVVDRLGGGPIDGSTSGFVYGGHETDQFLEAVRRFSPDAQVDLDS